MYIIRSYKKTKVLIWIMICCFFLQISISQSSTHEPKLEIIKIFQKLRALNIIATNISQYHDNCAGRFKVQVDRNLNNTHARLGVNSILVRGKYDNK